MTVILKYYLFDYAYLIWHIYYINIIALIKYIFFLFLLASILIFTIKINTTQFKKV